MKALTLVQPYASLIAIGVKRIETRSWSTLYRGPLAIHAAALTPVGDQSLADWHWPQGAVVATCRLVDVVPITGSAHGSPNANVRVSDFRHDGPRPHQQGGLWVVGWTEWQGGQPTRVEDQRPFGDFTPGRFAFLLADVEPLDPPVPAKGKHRLWEWADYPGGER